MEKLLTQMTILKIQSLSGSICGLIVLLACISQPARAESVDVERVRVQSPLYKDAKELLEFPLPHVVFLGQDDLARNSGFSYQAIMKRKALILNEMIYPLVARSQRAVSLFVVDVGNRVDGSAFSISIYWQDGHETGAVVRVEDGRLDTDVGTILNECDTETEDCY
jgi:hypothetical protein